ncbi:Copia protein, partial [Mucuna pruriens]
YCFFDTYFPITKLTTIRLLIAFASSQFWHLHQLDVHNAFLDSNLYEEVYMQFLPRNSTTRPNQICKLLKFIYDDLILVDNDLHEINHIKSFPNNNFKIKDFGYIKKFLGAEIT